MINKINFWYVLIVGLILVLLGVTFRINSKTVLSALLLILGMISEIIAVIFLITKAIQRSR